MCLRVTRRLIFVESAIHASLAKSHAQDCHVGMSSTRIVSTWCWLIDGQRREFHLDISIAQAANKRSRSTTTCQSCPKSLSSSSPQRQKCSRWVYKLPKKKVMTKKGGLSLKVTSTLDSWRNLQCTTAPSMNALSAKHFTSAACRIACRPCNQKIRQERKTCCARAAQQMP